MNRYRDWFQQAKKDLEAAKDSAKSEHYEWTCFQAQQSAEKALKSLLLSVNVESWGHGLVHLFQEWKNIISEGFSHEDNDEGDGSEDNSGKEYDTNQNDVKTEDKEKEIKYDMYEDIFEKCQDLDRHYIQPRYPNGFANGYPAEYYNKKIASRCIEYAKSIIRFVEEKIKAISSSRSSGEVSK